MHIASDERASAAGRDNGLDDVPGLRNARVADSLIAIEMKQRNQSMRGVDTKSQLITSNV